MRILELELKNINNLKGEHKLSFTEGRLSNAGIFAIVGPTGSGKSTILDVITLALFNKIPRFGNKSINKNEINKIGSVITHHTNNAYAKITYEVKGQQYKSEWNVEAITRGQNKGQIGEYDMVVYDVLTGQPITENKGEVPSKNEKIIGLEYDQFIKSIILSQGEFAKFIKAKKEERVKLLENITGTYIYREIGKKVFHRFREEESKYKIELDRLDQIVFLSDEDRKVIEDEITVGTGKKSAMDKELSQLTKIIKIKEDLQKFRTQNESKKIALTNLELKKTNLKPRLDKLRKFELIQPLVADIRLYKKAQEHVQIHQNGLTKNQSNLSQAKTELTAVMVEMSRIINKKVDKITFRPLMQAFEKEILSLEHKLENISEKGKETRNRINTKTSIHYPSFSQKINPIEGLELLKKDKGEIAQILLNAGVSSDISKEKIADKIERYQKLIQVYNNIIHVQEHINNSSSELAQLQVNIKDFHTEMKALKPLEEKTKQQLELIKEQIELYQKEKEHAIRTAELASHRAHLEDGKPCPLCGALEHPFSDDSSIINISQIDNKITSKKINQKEIEKELNQIAYKLTSTQSSLSITLKQSESIQKKLDQDQKSFSDLLSSSSIEKPNSVEESKAQLKNYNTKLEHLMDAQKAIDRIQINEELSKEFEHLESIYKEYSTLATKKKEKYPGENVSKECNDLQDIFIKNETKISSLSDAIKSDENHLKHAQKSTATILEKVNPQLKKHNLFSINQVDDLILKEEDIAEIKNIQEHINNTSIALKTELQNLEKEITTLAALDKDQSVGYQDVIESAKSIEKQRDTLMESLGKYSAQLKRDDEDKKRIQEKKAIIDKLKKELDKWSLLKKLIGDANGNNFANYAQGLTLKNLLSFANKRLKSLTDRYLLDMPNQGDGALTILDLYQGNTQRDVSTLSGGESFLVSLALALSLSDMASKNVELESLFIDEGFGTLDQETLDIAISTLEKLQTENQKMVGVISHVEALKERINVQVRLDRNAQGYSQIIIE